MSLGKHLDETISNARDLVRGYYGPDLWEADLQWDAPAMWDGDQPVRNDAIVSHAMGFILGVAEAMDMTPLQLLDEVHERHTTTTSNTHASQKRARKEHR